jgi:serine/arginine repetitive matrix protein 1
MLRSQKCRLGSSERPSHLSRLESAQSIRAWRDAGTRSSKSLIDFDSHSPKVRPPIAACHLLSLTPYVARQNFWPKSPDPPRRSPDPPRRTRRSPDPPRRCPFPPRRTCRSPDPPRRSSDPPRRTRRSPDPPRRSSDPPRRSSDPPRRNQRQRSEGVVVCEVLPANSLGKLTTHDGSTAHSRSTSSCLSRFSAHPRRPSSPPPATPPAPQLHSPRTVRQAWTGRRSGRAELPSNPRQRWTQ